MRVKLWTKRAAITGAAVLITPAGLLLREARAWAAAAGSSASHVCTASSADHDGDHVPDCWETHNGLKVGKADGRTDHDHDGLSARAEFKLDRLTHGDGIFAPFQADDADSNNNGVEDGDQDLDHDGIDNEDETPADAVDADTDNDGVEDGDEDSDHDGLSDGFEAGAVDADEDPDDDGMVDGVDDDDADGVDNADELNDQAPDSDEDGVSDAQEDEDGDGLDNEQEEQEGTDPTDEDSDDDGVDDGQDTDETADEGDTGDHGDSGDGGAVLAFATSAGLFVLRKRPVRLGR